MTDYKYNKAIEKQSSYPTKYIVGLVIALIIFIPCIVIAHQHQLTGWQLSVFRFFNNQSNSFKEPSIILTEGLGAGYAIAACVIIPAAFKRFKLAWRFLVSAAGAGAFMYVVKLIAKEPRPAQLLHGNLHVRVGAFGPNSFPSGHAVIATTLALTLWQVTPRRWRWLCVLWIILAGLLRIYVGDHTLIDVIGGFAIGLGAVCFVCLLPESFAKKVYLSSDDILEKGLPEKIQKLPFLSKL